LGVARHSFQVEAKVRGWRVRKP